jgi:hypothetical protein
MSAKVRIVVVLIFAVSFTVEVSDLIGTMMATGWQLVPVWEKALFFFSILVELCGALLAFWAYEDRKKIDTLWKAVFESQEHPH